MVNDLSYRPWEIATATVAALLKELSSPPSLRVEVIAMPEIRTVAVQPETPASPSPLPEDQIEKWVDESVPRTHREIRRFVVKEFGRDWGSVSTTTIMKAARENVEFKKRVPAFPSENTFNRALGRKE